MAYRRCGGGRGRGGFGGGFGSYGNPEPFILFPEDVVLPDINDIKKETALVVWNKKLQTYWKLSPYYLEKPTKKSKDNDIDNILTVTSQTVQLNVNVLKLTESLKINISLQNY
ncbi:hypothetical protein MKX01_034156 [Papaver californicum]|nr:hypothetical protein MKX01_034156 [Papaver californicum]